MIDEDAIESAASAGQDALVADAIVSGAKSGVRATGECRNCGAALSGRHCHTCGQVADDFHRPFWSLLADALEGLFSLDGRFWRTVPPLLVRPGRITRNYLSGIRARYMQPFRLFLLASVLFFLVFSISSGDMISFGPDVESDPERVDAAISELDRALAEFDEDEPGAAAMEHVRRELESARDAAAAAAAGVDEDPVIRALEEERSKRELSCAFREALVPEEKGPECDSILASAESRNEAPNVTLGGVDQWPIGIRRKLADNVEVVIDRPQTYIAELKEWAPRIVFVLSPVYALLLALMHFWRRKIYLYDHLIVSLHFHSFIFFFLTILIAVGSVAGAGIAVAAFFIWSNVYLYRIHRLVYGHGRISSVVRTVLLDFLYLNVLSVALIALAFIGLVSVS